MQQKRPLCLFTVPEETTPSGSTSIPRLKNDFNIVSLNLPGHGRSEGPGEQDVAIYVEWVEKILEKLTIRKPVLIGHSLGAAICLVFALQYGDRLSGIVPVGGGATMPVNQAILDGLKVDPVPVIAMVAKFSFAKSKPASGPDRDF